MELFSNLIVQFSVIIREIQEYTQFQLKVMHMKGSLGIYKVYIAIVSAVYLKKIFIIFSKSLAKGT